MLNIAIQHIIHLTKKQRYALHDGIDIVVTGISIPVWHLGKNTSEPAKEVFCNYYLRNSKNDIPLKIKKDGYEITLPYRKGEKLEISNEDWRELNLHNPDKLDLMYQQCKTEISSKNILDKKDGGDTHLKYREHSNAKHKDKIINVSHYVKILDIQELENSLL